MQYCTEGDVRNLLPGLPPDVSGMIQWNINHFSDFLYSQLVGVYDLPAGYTDPVLTLYVSYKTAAALLCGVMSSTNENGQTRLSEWYENFADSLLKNILSGVVALRDDDGEPVPAVPGASTCIALVTYDDTGRRHDGN